MSFYLFFMLSVCMSFIGFISIILNYSHFLSVLIVLEFITISVFLIFVMSLVSFSVEMYVVLYMLTFTVCTSALGLSILVFMVRSRGGEYLHLLNLMSW